MVAGRSHRRPVELGTPGSQRRLASAGSRARRPHTAKGSAPAKVAPSGKQTLIGCQFVVVVDARRGPNSQHEQLNRTQQPKQATGPNLPSRCSQLRSEFPCHLLAACATNQTACPAHKHWPSCQSAARPTSYDVQPPSQLTTHGTEGTASTHHL